MGFFFLKLVCFQKTYFLFSVSHAMEKCLLRAKPDYSFAAGSWHSFSLLFRYTVFEWRCRNLVWGLQKVMMAADAFKQDAVLWQCKTESNQSCAEYSCTSTMNPNLVISHVLTAFIWKKAIDFFGAGECSDLDSPLSLCVSPCPTTTAGGHGRIKMNLAIKFSAAERSESGRTVESGCGSFVYSRQEYLACSPAAR